MKFVATTLIFLLHVLVVISSSSLMSCSQSENMTEMVLCKTQSPYTVPPDRSPEFLPLKVATKIDFYDITDVNAADHSVTVYLDVRLTWNDTGLSYVKPDNTR